MQDNSERSRAYGLDPSQSLNYNFAHMTLPVLALWNSRKFYKEAFSHDGQRYLNRVWETVADRIGSSGRLKSLATSGDVSFSERTRAIVIGLPPPFVSLDAIFIAVVVSVRRRLLWTKLNWLRYFTLELGDGPATSSPAYHVCEWTSLRPRTKHLNYGTIDQPSIRAFLDAIGELLRVRQAVDPRSTINSRGEVAGRVEEDADGKSLIITNGNSDFTSMAYSLALIFAKTIESGDRAVFSRWAGLSTEEWTPKHHAVFALAQLHYFKEAHRRGRPLREDLHQIPANLQDADLPPLTRPLSREVIAFFDQVYGQ